MSSDETAVAVRNKDLELALNEKGTVELKTLDDFSRFAKWVVESRIAPKGATVSSVVVQMQVGAELGFSRMQSLTQIAVINGRATLEGAAMMALLTSQDAFDPAYPYDMGCRLQSTGKLDDKGVDIPERVGWVKTMKVGWTEPRETTFTWAEAKAAGLTTKSGPWKEYPQRMLMWRAVGHHVKQYYPEITSGLMLKEVALDTIENIRIEQARVVSPAAQVGDEAPDPLLGGVIEAEVVGMDVAEPGGDSTDVWGRSSVPDAPTRAEIIEPECLNDPPQPLETEQEAARECSPEPSEVQEPAEPAQEDLGGPDSPCEEPGCILIGGHRGNCDFG